MLPHILQRHRRLVMGAPSFNPTQVPAVTGWLRLANRTDTGTLTIPDVLGGASALQSSASLKPAFSTSNGLPVMTFDGGDTLRRATDANTHATPRRGLAAWIKLNSVAVTQAFWGAWTADFVNRIHAVYAVNDTMAAAVGLGGPANARQGVSGAVLDTGWHFWTWEYDGGQTAEADKCILTLDGAVQSLTFSVNSGTAAAMPATLQTESGDSVIGALNAAPSIATTATYGPNVYLLGGAGVGPGLLTSAQRAALMAFENPTP
jgi:hypothetical protein